MTANILTWDDVYDRVASNFPAVGKAWGVPRGGSVAAGLTGRAVLKPEDADFIVDDMIDSGATRESVLKRYDKPFYALVDKSSSRKDIALGWVVFPWEGEAESGPEQNIVRLLQHIGEDPAREGLLETPQRVVKAWAEMTAGYKQDPAAILAKDFDSDDYDEMVVCRDIEFVSSCEHHMLPFTGVAHVGYLPGKRVVGLSKMARLVDCYSRRLQVQERLTRQVAVAMRDHLNPAGVGVTIVAKHSCMSCRGVGKQRPEVVTSTLLGAFMKPEVRAEFFDHCRGGAK